MTFNAQVTILLVAISFSAMAQNEVDALRYSQVTFGGTARFNALSGAFGALGGDLSVTSVNPAGLSIYRASEFSFTPGVLTQITRSTHYESTVENANTYFNLGTIGVVFTGLKDGEGGTGWVGSHFGLTFNRHNDFNGRTYISGTNASSSLLDQYVAQIDGLTQSEVADADLFGSSLAWNTFLINPIDTIDTTTYIGIVSNGGVRQQKYIETSGGLNEMDITLSGNYGNKFYIGATMGFHILNYTEKSTYTEIDEEDTIAYFTSFVLDERLETRGEGFNFKLGMLFRPVDWMRFGGAIHTPTYWNMNDRYSSNMTADFDSIPFWSREVNTHYTSSSPTGEFDYDLYTPWRVIGSAALIVGKRALISVDYELIDYSVARLRSRFYGFDAENSAIADKYKRTNNVRIGTELKFNPLSIRGGYALYGSPYKDGVNDGVRENYSFGFGIREDDFYIDFAYVYSITSEDYYLYSGELVDPTLTTTETHNFQTTLGFRF